MNNKALEKALENQALEQLKTVYDGKVEKQQSIYLNGLEMGRVDLYIEFPNSIIMVEVKYDMDLHTFEHANGQLINYKACTQKSFLKEGIKKRIVLAILCNSIVRENTKVAIKVNKRKVFTSIEQLIEFVRSQQ